METGGIQSRSDCAGTARRPAAIMADQGGISNKLGASMIVLHDDSSASFNIGRGEDGEELRIQHTDPIEHQIWVRNE